MNSDFSSKQVFDAISLTANTFFNNLIGSAYWRMKQDNTISETYKVSGIQINLELKDFVKPDGMPILPQSQINSEWLNSGSYFGIVEVKIPNENKFSIQAPHNKLENQVHLQKGKEKIILPPFTGYIATYRGLGSALFLKFETEEDAINKIQEIREK